MITETVVTTVTQVVPEPDLRVDEYFRPRWLHESIRVQTDSRVNYLVYKYLVSKSWRGKTDTVVIDLQEFAKALGINRPTIRNQIKRLIEKKYIEPIKFDSIHEEVHLRLTLITKCMEMWGKMGQGFGGETH